MDIYEKITEYPKYEINKLGQVRRQYRNGNITYPKKCLGKNGYYTVSLHNHTYTLHRLLGKQFIPNPDNLPVIDHIDRNRQNNSLDNLRWSSIIDNNRNRTKKGCIYEATDINKQYNKVYKYYRCHWYENQKQKSKRFKTKTEAEIFLKSVNS